MLRLEQLRIVQHSFTLEADLTVETSRKVAVIGPSGAGKSTLLSAIGGFLPSVSGKVFLNGDDISDAPPGNRALAMLFQDNNLFPHLTVEQNVSIGLKPSLRLTKEERSIVLHAITRVGLAGMEKRKPGALSGGQLSRAALARVLVQNRSLILLDEPFAALGPALRMEMLDLVRALVEETGATLLMITHSPEDVARIADDVIFVEGGRAHAPEPAAALMEDPPPALKAYLG
ncbi:MAG: ATP-binding cassette domain-containing protein [Pseudomonadota bacterium]